MESSHPRLDRFHYWARMPITLVRMLFKEQSYLRQVGYFRAYAMDRSELLDGSVLPFLCYGMARILMERLTKDMVVFEYGSGFSTHFFAQRVKRVVSAEHDEFWYQRVAAQKPANSTILFRERDEDGLYCRAILATGDTFDIVLIDGIDRVNCVPHAFEVLSPTGVILFDDTHRPEYEGAIDSIRKRGFKRLDIEGAKPASYRIGRTAILYRSDNCLNI